MGLCRGCVWDAGKASGAADRSPSLPGSASARATLVVRESCGEPSPVPWLSRALGPSLMEPQTSKEAEEESSEGHSTLQGLGRSLTGGSGAHSMLPHPADPRPGV